MFTKYFYIYIALFAWREKKKKKRGFKCATVDTKVAQHIRCLQLSLNNF